MFFVYLLSGLFLGWSLGANDAANVFGTAVGSKMIRFRTAALVFSAFVTLGAVIGGAGAVHTLGQLGGVNALGGSFTVALAAALTIAWMVRLRLPVSTSQSIVGAIIGWNLFSGNLTDLGTLTRILSGWVLCPVLAGVLAILLLHVVQRILGRYNVHIFRIDAGIRIGLFVVGAFASFSLGANNIANVMGVFVPASPLQDVKLLYGLTLSGPQQLFLLGGLAITVGVCTHSRNVMLTVGSDLFKLSPIAALVVVLAEAIVLFVFSSQGLEKLLQAYGLPTIPLVPVSSSQAVIGAVLGIGLAKGGRNVNYTLLGKICSGWIATPIMSAALCFMCLFIVQNLFAQKVFVPVRFALSEELLQKLMRHPEYDNALEHLLGREFPNAAAFKSAVQELIGNSSLAREVVLLSEVRPLTVDIERLEPFYDYSWYTAEQIHAVFRLHGQTFAYRWQLADRLSSMSDHWRRKEDTNEHRMYNQELNEKLQVLYELFGRPL